MPDDDVIRSKEIVEWDYRPQGTNSRPQFPFSAETRVSSPRQTEPSTERPLNVENVENRGKALLEQLQTAKNKIPLLDSEWLPKRTNWRLDMKHFLWFHMHKQNYYSTNKNDINETWVEHCIGEFAADPKNGASLRQCTKTDRERFSERIRTQMTTAASRWKEDGLIQWDKHQKRFFKTETFRNQWYHFDGSFRSIGGGEALTIESDNDELPENVFDAWERSTTPQINRSNKPVASTSKEQIKGPLDNYLASPPLTGKNRRATETEAVRNSKSGNPPKKTKINKAPKEKGIPKTRRSAIQPSIEEEGESPRDTRSKTDKGKAPERPILIEDEILLPSVEEQPAAPSSPYTPPRDFRVTNSPGTLVNEPLTSPIFAEPTNNDGIKAFLMIQEWDSNGKLNSKPEPYEIDNLISNRRTASAATFFDWYQREAGSMRDIVKLEFVFPGRSDTVHKIEVGREDESKFRRVSTMIWTLKRAASADEEGFMVMVSIPGT